MIETYQFVPVKETKEQKKLRKVEHKKLMQSFEEHKATLAKMPTPFYPKHGEKVRENVRGQAFVNPVSHKVSTKILQLAYPFLAETSAPMQGCISGYNMLSKRPYALDPWEAYAAKNARSFSICLFGPPGTGKSFFAKILASRLIVAGVKIAVPADPKGEWNVFAHLHGGSVIQVGPGLGSSLNPFDVPKRDDLSQSKFEDLVLQIRRNMLRQIVTVLKDGDQVKPEEYTALELALDAVRGTREDITIRDVLEVLKNPPASALELVEREIFRHLFHTLRIVVHGELKGMFDQKSTVQFDTNSPVCVVDTSFLERTTKKGKAIVNLITSNWVKQAISVPGRGRRVIVNEEAAIGLLADISSSGGGLSDKVENQKLQRDDDVSHWYLFHRPSDLEALGDAGSALRSQAEGLIADTDIRIALGQTTDTANDVAKLLGLNNIQKALTLQLDIGEGIFLIGNKRADLVAITPTAEEFDAYQTDTVSRKG